MSIYLLPAHPAIQPRCRPSPSRSRYRRHSISSLCISCPPQRLVLQIGNAVTTANICSPPVANCLSDQCEKIRRPKKRRCQKRTSEVKSHACSASLGPSSSWPPRTAQPCASVKTDAALHLTARVTSNQKATGPFSHLSNKPFRKARLDFDLIRKSVIASPEGPSLFFCYIVTCTTTQLLVAPTSRHGLKTPRFHQLVTSHFDSPINHDGQSLRSRRGKGATL